MIEFVQNRHLQRQMIALSLRKARHDIARRCSRLHRHCLLVVPGPLGEAGLPTCPHLRPQHGVVAHRLNDGRSVWQQRQLFSPPA